MVEKIRWSPGEPIPAVLTDRNARRVVIDGVSGAGKTTLAKAWAAQQDYLVLHLDSWYPGWLGLAEGTNIAEALLSGAIDRYPEWDWETQQVRRLVPVQSDRPWIVEGCGSLTPVTKAFADLTLWVDVPLEVGRERGLRRDGATYLPWWEKWHSQELEHWSINNPRSLADIVVNAG